MIHKIFRVTCDCCNRREFNEGDESKLDAFWHAQFNGWSQRKVPNGSIWDMCPECSKLEVLP